MGVDRNDHIGTIRRLAGDRLHDEHRVRARVADALHDRIGQTLAAARMKLGLLGMTRDGLPPEVLAGLEFVQRCLDDSMDEARRLMHELSPPPLRNLGWLGALRWLGREAERRHGLTIELDGSAFDERRPDGRAGPVLFEALDRLFAAARADGATRLRLTLAHDGEALTLRVPVAGAIDYDALGEALGWFDARLALTDEAGQRVAIFIVPCA